ncbi:hypothetical protein M8997_006955 [Phyllobacterium sp. 21LDTY02-6]|jgi:hypothetical protein|uniref:hypothetical protein n=1 Tax=unclassified Phyllobacterium TaxID=2638441 RepID=UPI002020FB97|nr:MULTISPECIES: hypothetical protein [unclassified Phyllobacterium]MCO4316916.1 hypothetical protein [Phyllobacterium sp. 21LDTY02-6]MCX8281803.1 hypothetical protein [Phyllobacterium sp. 0TCS1.6C]MCX8295338.1 hypothetical protein [Phyllobacterium sp. 0TCS1.6A]
MNDIPDWNEIQDYLFGAWRMMTGHADGLERLDISEDGFWKSFHAITISLPPLILSWIIFANDLIAARPEAGSRLSIMGRVAFVDLTAWVLPLVLLALVARPLGISKRYSPYVVATNWGTVIAAWMMAPATVLRTLLPGWPAVTAALGLALYAMIMVLTYRLTHIVLKKSYAYSAAFFIALMVGSLFLMLLLQTALDISAPEAVTIG